MNTVRCPSCHSDVIVEDEAYEGDLVDCVNCGAQLELVALHPPQVKLFEEDSGEETTDDLAPDKKEPVDNPEDDLG